MPQMVRLSVHRITTKITAEVLWHFLEWVGSTTRNNEVFVGDDLDLDFI